MVYMMTIRPKIIETVSALDTVAHRMQSLIESYKERARAH